MDDLVNGIVGLLGCLCITPFVTVLLWNKWNDGCDRFGDFDDALYDALSTPDDALVLTWPQSDHGGTDLSETVAPPEEEGKLVAEMLAEYCTVEFSSSDLALIPNQGMGETDKIIAAPPSCSGQTYWHRLNQWQQSSSHTGDVEYDHQMPESSLPTYEEPFHKEGQRFRAKVFDSSNWSNMNTYKGSVEATGSSALVSQQTEAWVIAPFGMLTKQLGRSEDLNNFAPHVSKRENANFATPHWSPTGVLGSSHQNKPRSEQQGKKTMSPSCKTLSASEQTEKPGSSKDLRNLHSSTLEVVIPEGILRSGRAIHSCSDLAPEATPSITSLIRGGQYLQQEVGLKHSVAEKTVEGVLKFGPCLGHPETINALTFPSPSASDAFPQAPMVTVDVMLASTNVGSQGIAKVSAGKKFTTPTLSEYLTSKTFYQSILELVGMDCSAAAIKLNGDKRRGGSDTTFRRRCRENGILRWPNCRDTNECDLFKQIVKEALQIAENSQGSDLTKPQSTGDQFLKNILSVQEEHIRKRSIVPFFGYAPVYVSKMRKTNLPDSCYDDKESEEAGGSSRLVFKHTQPKDTTPGEMQTKLGCLENSRRSAIEAVTEQMISESSQVVHTCSDLAVKQDMTTSPLTSHVSGRLNPQQKVGLKRPVPEKTIDGMPKRICKGNEKQCFLLKEKLVSDLCSKDSKNSHSSSSTTVSSVALLETTSALIVPSSMSGGSPHPAMVTIDVFPASTITETQGLATGNVSVVPYVELEKRADEHEVSIVPGVDEVLKGLPRQYHDIMREVWLKHNLTFRNVKSLTPIIRVGTLGVLGELLFQIRGTNFMDVTLTVLQEFHETLEFLKQNSYDIEWIQNHLNHIAGQRDIFEALGKLQATRERRLEELNACNRLIEERKTQLGQAMNGSVDVDIGGNIDQGLL